MRDEMLLPRGYFTHRGTYIATRLVAASVAMSRIGILRLLLLLALWAISDTHSLSLVSLSGTAAAVVFTLNQHDAAGATTSSSSALSSSPVPDVSASSVGALALALGSLPAPVSALKGESPSSSHHTDIDPEEAAMDAEAAKLDEELGRLKAEKEKREAATTTHTGDPHNDASAPGVASSLAANEGEVKLVTEPGSVLHATHSHDDVSKDAAVAEPTTADSSNIPVDTRHVTPNDSNQGHHASIDTSAKKNSGEESLLHASSSDAEMRKLAAERVALARARVEAAMKRQQEEAMQQLTQLTSNSQIETEPLFRRPLDRYHHRSHHHRHHGHHGHHRHYDYPDHLQSERAHDKELLAYAMKQLVAETQNKNREIQDLLHALKAGEGAADAKSTEGAAAAGSHVDSVLASHGGFPWLIVLTLLLFVCIIAPVAWLCCLRLLDMDLPSWASSWFPGGSGVSGRGSRSSRAKRRAWRSNVAYRSINAAPTEETISEGDEEEDEEDEWSESTPDAERDRRSRPPYHGEDGVLALDDDEDDDTPALSPPASRTVSSDRHVRFSVPSSKKSAVAGMRVDVRGVAVQPSGPGVGSTSHSANKKKRAGTPRHASTRTHNPSTSQPSSHSTDGNNDANEDAVTLDLTNALKDPSESDASDPSATGAGAAE